MWDETPQQDPTPEFQAQELAACQIWAVSGSDPFTPLPNYGLLGVLPEREVSCGDREIIVVAAGEWA